MTVPITIITAAYNIEAYLPGCLDSILNQTFRDFELVLVDDGSMDSTGRICDTYAEKDKRIRVIHQRNQGVSDAWNNALQTVKTEYVGFVDGDDLIHPRMYEILYRAIVETESDIAYCGYRGFYGDGSDLVFDDLTDCGIRMSSQSEELKKISFSGFPNGAHIWKGLYRYKNIKDLRFLSGRTWQDRMWSPCAVICADKISRVDRILYYYRIRPGSNSHSNLIKHYLNGMYVGARLLDWLQENAPEWYTLFVLRQYSSCVNLYNRLSLASEEERKTAAEEIQCTLNHLSKVSIMDILREPNVRSSRKLTAVIGKFSFPLSCEIKKSLLKIRDK
ncbi:MAG: glycosyltransferase [Erysipelotrichaceae bacterium]|nr:glycosyltransferase [Erysipelotrichaceae bacterium]